MVLFILLIHNLHDKLWLKTVKYTLNCASVYLRSYSWERQKSNPFEKIGVLNKKFYFALKK